MFMQLTNNTFKIIVAAPKNSNLEVPIASNTRI